VLLRQLLGRSPREPRRLLPGDGHGDDQMAHDRPLLLGGPRAPRLRDRTDLAKGRAAHLGVEQRARAPGGLLLWLLRTPLTLLRVDPDHAVASQPPGLWFTREERHDVEPSRRRREIQGPPERRLHIRALVAFGRNFARATRRDVS
jgi:hypothetical protein